MQVVLTKVGAVYRVVASGYAAAYGGGRSDGQQPRCPRPSPARAWPD
jgi:hypothetical protein